MIVYDKANLSKVAKDLGFIRDTYEKVLRLIKVLDYLNSDDLLSSHFVLKGGTALNLVYLDLPRLSVDIDLDFIPDIDMEDMLALRKVLTERIVSYMEENGYPLSPYSRYSHSLDALVFDYRNAGGNKDYIQVELNYSLRSHVLPSVIRPIYAGLSDREVTVRVLDSIEIFATKVNALMNRAKPRDLYDVINMIDNGFCQNEQKDLLRKCIIFYACISAPEVNKDFDVSAIDEIKINSVKRQLLPVIKKKEFIDIEFQKRKAKEYIKDLMVLTSKEMKFMDLFEDGVYCPDLLFDDTCVLNNVLKHPMALWKCKSKVDNSF